MKKFNKLLLSICVCFILIITGLNIYVQKGNFENESQEYRVSVNRMEYDIKAYEEKYQSVANDIDSLCTFAGVDNYPGIVSFDVIGKESDEEVIANFVAEKEKACVISYSKYGFYKIFYSNSQRVATKLLVVVNGALIVVFMMVMGIMLYIKDNIMKPFHRITDMPYELSKGNLTVPVKENANRFFGRFLWGMDLLRENIEEQKRTELELQKEKKMLLLSLAHDIKTPLSAVKLYAKALEKNIYTDSAKKDMIIKNINVKADEIEAYIAEIVKASNEDFLQFEVNNCEIYINSVLDKVKTYYKDKMELNHIDFSIDQGRNCLVMADEERLVEVIQNVVENAMKYGDGKRIWIDTGHNGEEYSIHIYNTGCTLEKKECPHIFDSFYRGSNVENKNGSGLGLYICRELVHLMDGEVTATMEDGVMGIHIVIRLV